MAAELIEPFVGRDNENRRTFAMWDECGIRFRSNSVLPGGRIPLHSHTYDHIAAVWGQFRLTTTAPDGTVEVIDIERGKLLIPRGTQHLFEYLGDSVGEVLCFWPIGADGAE